MKSVFGPGKSVFGSVASSSYIIILSVVFIAAVILIANKQQIQEGFFNNNYRVEYYYMVGCHHCEEFDATWEELIKAGEFTKITLKKFGSDTQEGRERLTLMKITSFPTIVIVDNSREVPKIIASFNDERKFEKISNFIKKYDI
jgi:hypothetical protein